MSASDVADATLVDRAIDGDHTAFAALLQRHDGAMRSLAYRLLQSRTAMDDGLQDAYVKAYKSLRRFDGRSSFGGWLHVIVRNTCLDHLRSTKRRGEIPLDAVPDPAVGDTTGRLDDADRIRAALATLPPDQRAAVVLVDCEGMSYAAVAELLGVAPGTIASRLNRARAELRRTLTNQHEEGQR